MPCYHPLVAYKCDGKVVFDKPLPFAKGFNLPCGQCIGCRLEYSRQWAVRLVHEAQMHEQSCFITLTFSPEELMKRENPASLDKRDFQLFIKRFRKRYEKKIRFFHCGEYGELNKRPHYHALIYGHDFPDRKLWKTSGDVRLYISEELSSLWPYGFSTVGAVTFDSAAYCARYVTKKVTGEAAADHYVYTDKETGEVIELQPEYATMSRRPGIGKGWFDKYKNDVFPRDYVVVNNHKIKPPRYYDNLLSEDELQLVKEKRMEDAQEPIIDYGHEMDRLWVQEEVKINKLKQLIRDI